MIIFELKPLERIEKMNAYHLPEFLNAGQDCDVYLHHYRSTMDYLKNKIVLSKNLICILLNGTKEVFGPHESIKIDNREFLLIRSGNVLMWESIAQGNKLESLLIFFSNKVLKEFCRKQKLDVPGHGDEHRAVVSMKKDEYLLAFENSLKALEDHDLPLIQTIKVEELLTYLAMKNRSGSFYSFVKNVIDDENANKLRDVVEANMSKGLAIDELAFLCHMSVSTFKRHFARTFKCSPKKYFTNKRMEKAKEWLLLERRPSEIYLDLRYQNLSSFSNEFKKHFGISPRQFQSQAAIR
jgi:AraC family transcriptional regulator, exoenzyme S synthesis regulatory protein ExsA